MADSHGEKKAKGVVGPFLFLLHWILRQTAKLERNCLRFSNILLTVHNVIPYQIQDVVPYQIQNIIQFVCMYTPKCYENSVHFMVGFSDVKKPMLVSGKEGGVAINLKPLEFKLFVQEFDDMQGCQFKRDDSSVNEIKEEGGDGIEQGQKVKIFEEEMQEDNFDMFVSSLKVKINPSSEESGVLESEDKDEDEGMKTPTSLDHKIIVSLKSPPGAPRKPKALPLKKRKANRQPRFVIDLSSEIQLLFPPINRADVLGGDKLKKKKSRQESS